MDLTTRCPHCGTTFPASLEQLLLRKGYIRCINCANIFDGYEAVVSGDPAAHAASPQKAEPSVQQYEPFTRHISAASTAPDVDTGTTPRAVPQPSVSPRDPASLQSASQHDTPAAKSESGPRPEPRQEPRQEPAQEPAPATSHTISAAASTAAVAGHGPSFSISAVPPHADANRDGSDAASSGFSIDGAVRRRSDQRVSTPQRDISHQPEAGAAPAPEQAAPGSRQEPVIGVHNLRPQAAQQPHFVVSSRPAAAEPPPVVASRPTAHTPKPAPDVRTPSLEQRHPREVPAPMLPIRSREPLGADSSHGGVYIEPRNARSSDRDIGADMHERGAGGLFARVFWRTLVVVGIAVLLAQLVYVYRAQIANQVPILRPMLESACASLDCDVPYAREISAISIMDSTLRAEAASTTDNAEPKSVLTDTLVLSLTLRNTYHQPQEWPTLELKLHDFSGTLVVRKNLSPEDYLPAEVASQPFPAGSEITARVPIVLDGHKISGFHLDKFFQ
ncbi:DUF3426 domain-containing protein [Allopusillimonas ginsengisoli]|uniref:DUF3426 domain-containing protein n=1 Tax=Allopusillimonas ginsengisoli TaxID=453575 RepID=UPI0010C1D592|nr:DUF3426 domain-containing protein [Allopusillimonas ginsengisoli]